jgi:hypothetical protein
MVDYEFEGIAKNLPVFPNPPFRNTNIKVIGGLIFPPYIFWLDFKSKEELMLQAQTVSEHHHDLLDASSSSDETNSSSGTSSDEWDTSECELKVHQQQQRKRLDSRTSRKTSASSENSHYGTVK